MMRGINASSIVESLADSERRRAFSVELEFCPPLQGA
jgi:hypothetical protein